MCCLSDHSHSDVLMFVWTVIIVILFIVPVGMATNVLLFAFNNRQGCRERRRFGRFHLSDGQSGGSFPRRGSESGTTTAGWSVGWNGDGGWAEHSRSNSSDAQPVYHVARLTRGCSHCR